MSNSLVPITAKPPRKRATTAGLTDWDRIIPMWLHGRPESTKGTYLPAIVEFRRHVADKPIGLVTLQDLQDFADTLVAWKQSTVERKLATIRSLLSFCYKTGLITFDVGRALRIPKVPDTLIEKLLSEAEIQRMIEAAPDKQTKILLRVLYAAGIRASEAAGLRWMDVKPRNTAGQITVLGKGSKVRAVLLPAPIWKALLEYRTEKFNPLGYVFHTRKGGPIDRTNISHMVERAGRLAGIDKAVSAHWMRHGHASHAIDRGAPLTLVQRTLGHSDIRTTTRYVHAHPDKSSSQYISA